MKWGNLLPWRHRKLMRENVEKERARTKDVQQNVIGPLRDKRERFEHNHLAEKAAKSLGIIH